ncbi:MAG: hypothetical protein KBF21_08570 [Thermoanaerobaculia bacterium]|nr:hypothetical protein [Thermoanaerobaculia bacterium]MBP9824260.1 hypothetical protein [Thermoanaerobaculia bacterium]
MLLSRKVAVKEERSARNALSEMEVKELLGSVDEVWIARGKKVEKLAAEAAKPDDLRGPTGNFRAPMLRRGRRLLVGFHAASVEELAD